MGRINTTKTLSNDNFFANDGGELPFSSGPISINSWVEARYDYAVTEDIVLLNERKDTDELIHKIFFESKFATKYITDIADEDGNNTAFDIRIPKADVGKVFDYTMQKLKEHKKISIFESVIAICEFYNFSYKTIFYDVLTPVVQQQLIAEIYDMGIKKDIEKEILNPLF